MSSVRKPDSPPQRHAFAIDELARSIDCFRRSLAELRPSLLADQKLSGPAAVARQLYQARRKRADFLPDSSDLFGEPAWDIILDLFIAGEAGHAMPMTDVSIGACAPASAAQRWIAVLENRGLVERYSDPQDRRRTLVRLTEPAADGMRRYLAAF